MSNKRVSISLITISIIYYILDKTPPPNGLINRNVIYAKSLK